VVSLCARRTSKRKRTVIRSTGPVEEARLGDQGGSDEQNDRTGDERGKDALEFPRVDKGESDLCQTAQSARPEQGAPGFGAGLTGLASTGVVERVKDREGGGEGGERRSDDRDQARAEVDLLLEEGNWETDPAHLDHREDSGRDERGRDHVGLSGGVEI
jgi:hypothetical protein